MATRYLHLHHATSDADVSVVQPVAMAALAGVAGAIVMAGHAMIASATKQHHGVFTPLSHIGPVFISPNDLMMSMKAAMGGSTYTFFLGAAFSARSFT